jgi:hypothetical protein
MNTTPKQYLPAPSREAALAAYHDLKTLLHPSTGDPFKCDNFSRKRYEAMLDFLNFYTHPQINQRLPWMEASFQASQLHGRTKPFAESLRRWGRQYIDDRSLPQNLYGKHLHSMIENEDLAQDIMQHLKNIGDAVTSTDLMEYTNDLALQQKHGLKKGISMTTAKRWMESLGFKRDTFENGKSNVCFPKVLSCSQSFQLTPLLMMGLSRRVYRVPHEHVKFAGYI